VFGDDNRTVRPAQVEAACCMPAAKLARIPMNADAGGSCCG
jgi:hypothetical protein